MCSCGTKKSLYDNSFGKDLFECRGNEPYWNIKMEPDVIVFAQPGAEKLYFPYRDATEEEEGTLVFKTFIQDGNKSTRLKLILTKKECSDSMSGESFPFSASAELDGKTFTGCAK